jgi:hypothetical protein
MTIIRSKIIRYLFIFLSLYLTPKLIFTQATGFTRVLEVTTPRMQGEDVRILQQQLVDRGFSEVGEVDGYYGPLTHKAIERFCYRNGIEFSDQVSIEIQNNIGNSRLIGGEYELSTPVFIGFGSWFLGGWSQDEGWIEAKNAFRWFDTNQELEMLAFASGTILGSYIFIPEQMNLLGFARSSPLLIIPSELENVGFNWVITNQYNEINYPVLEYPNSESGNLELSLFESVLQEWQSNENIGAEFELEIHSLDFNKDELTDYILEAKNNPSEEENTGFTQVIFLLICTEVQGKIEYTPVKLAQTITEPNQFYYLVHSYLGAIDANYDGKLEILLSSRYYEGYGIQLKEIKEDYSTKVVLSAGAGA